jgi:hypothetical protein
MRRNKFKLTAWCCGILSAAINLQSAGAAPAEESPKPNVKETSKQLEEVIKLLKQGENPTAEAGAQEAKEPDKKTKAAQTKAKH